MQLTAESGHLQSDCQGRLSPHSRHRLIEFNQIMFATAANGRKEPSLLIFCAAAKVRFRDTVEITN